MGDGLYSWSQAQNEDTPPLHIQERPTVAPRNNDAPAAYKNLAEDSATPFLDFNGISNLTTCDNTIITWNYIGPELPMTLFVMNESDWETLSETGHSQTPSSTGSSTLTPHGDSANGTRSSSTITLNEAIDPVTQSYAWTAVNAVAGHYRLTATISSKSFNSSDFFVQNGTDVSCLMPPSEGQQSNRVSAGTIGGSVAGGVAFLAVVAVILCMRRRLSAFLRRTIAKSSPREFTERESLPRSELVDLQAEVIQPYDMRYVDAKESSSPSTEPTATRISFVPSSSGVSAERQGQIQEQTDDLKAQIAELQQEVRSSHLQVFESAAAIERLTFQIQELQESQSSDGRSGLTHEPPPTYGI